MTTKISFKYLVPRLLADRARLVNDAMTAKNVALSSTGACLAIQASIGIIAIWPKGDSNVVSTRAMNRASTTPPVQLAVHCWMPK